MKPDCILLDLTMPRLDGRQTLKLIRESRPKQPVIMMSGAYARGENDPDLLGEAQGFLAKPFSISDLRECLAKILMKRS